MPEVLEYQSLRALQRKNLWDSMPDDFGEFKADWWKLATHYGEKGDKRSEEWGEEIRKQIFDRGKNLNEIQSDWVVLSPAHKKMIANVLGKAGVIDEMMVEELRGPNRAQYEGSALDEAAKLSGKARVFAKPTMISLQEGAIPPRYKWKSLGTIGFLEGFGTTKWAEKIPFMGAGISMGKIRLMRQAKEALIAERKGERELTDDERNQARYAVTTFMEEANYMSARGHSFAGGVRNLIVDMLPWMAEFYLLGGIGAKGRAAGTAIATRLAAKVGVKMPVLAAKAAGVAGEVTARTLALPARVGESVERKMLAGKDTGAAIVKGFADVWTEVLSEMAGQTLMRAAHKIPLGGKARIRVPIISKLLLKLETGLSKLAPAKIRKLAARIGYHGPVPEIAEEEFKRTMNAIGGLGEFGLTEEESNILTRFIASRPTLKQHMQEWIAFSIPAIPGAAMRMHKESIAEQAGILEQAARKALPTDRPSPGSLRAKERFERSERHRHIEEFMARQKEAAPEEAPPEPAHAEAQAELEETAAQLEQLDRGIPEDPPAQADMDASVAIGNIRERTPETRPEPDILKRQPHGAWEFVKEIAGTAQLSMDSNVERVAPPGSHFADVVYGRTVEGRSDAIRGERETIKEREMEIEEETGLVPHEMESWAEERYGERAQKKSVPLESGTIELYRDDICGLIAHTYDSNTVAEFAAPAQQGFYLTRQPDVLIPLSQIDMHTLRTNPEFAEERAVVEATMRRLNADNKMNREFHRTQHVRKEAKGEKWQPRGDWFPRRRRGRDIKRGIYITEEQYEFDPDLRDMPFTKHRERSNAPIAVEGLSTVFARAVAQKWAVAKMALPIERARQLINHSVVADEIIRRHKRGKRLIRDINNALTHLEGLKHVETGAIDKVVKKFIRQFHRAKLGLKPWIVAYQKVSYILPLADGSIPLKHLMNPKNIAIMFTGKGAKAAEVRAMLEQESPYITARMEARAYGVITPMSHGMASDSIFGPRKFRFARGLKLANIGDLLDQIAFGMIHWSDSTTILGLASAIRDMGEAQGLEGNALAKFVARKTEEVVRRTQPTWDATTVSTLAREAKANPLKHLAVMFSSQRNKNLNILFRAWNDFRHSEQTPVEYAKLVRAVMVVTTQNAIIYGILHGTLRLVGGKPREWEDHILGVLSRVFGNWLIAGDHVTDYVVKGVGVARGDSLYFTRRRQGPLSGTIEDTLLAFSYAGKYIEYATSHSSIVNKKKARTALRNAIRYGLQGPATFLGIPGGGPEMILRRLFAKKKKKKRMFLPLLGED